MVEKRLEIATDWPEPGSTANTVIHLQFWAYGSLDSMFPISMSPTENLRVQNTILMTNLQYYCILELAEIKTLHPRDKIMH